MPPVAELPQPCPLPNQTGECDLLGTHRAGGFALQDPGVSLPVVECVHREREKQTCQCRNVMCPSEDRGAVDLGSKIKLNLKAACSMSWGVACPTAGWRKVFCLMRQSLWMLVFFFFFLFIILTCSLLSRASID